MKRHSRAPSSRPSRIRGDMFHQQMELAALEESTQSSAESYATNLMLRFVAKKEVTMPDLLGVNRPSKGGGGNSGNGGGSGSGGQNASSKAAGTMSSAACRGGSQQQLPLQPRRRRPAPSRQVQLVVLLLCHYFVVAVSLFLFGLLVPRLLRQSPITEPWLTMWMVGCYMSHLLLLAVVVPVIFPSLLRACCHDFLRHLRLARFDYD